MTSQSGKQSIAIHILSNENPLETSENLDVFRGYRKATPGCNGLNSQQEVVQQMVWYILAYHGASFPILCP